jgi:hypothetical protein
MPDWPPFPPTTRGPKTNVRPTFCLSTLNLILTSYLTADDSHTVPDFRTYMDLTTAHDDSLTSCATTLSPTTREVQFLVASTAHLSKAVRDKIEARARTGPPRMLGPPTTEGSASGDWGDQDTIRPNNGAHGVSETAWTKQTGRQTWFQIVDSRVTLQHLDC